MHTNNTRIIFLDYLRIFAFLSVLIGHKLYPEIQSFIQTFSTPHITQKYLADYILSMFMGGGAGVVVFFMISGYIILYVLQSEKPTEFLIKRIFRIYPLLIIAIIIEAILYNLILDVPFNFKNMFLQGMLIGDFFNTPYSLAGVEWTLRVEIMFYLFMASLRFMNIFKYSVYLFHNFLWLFISKGLQYFGIESKALTLSILFIFCFFTYKLIEKPFIVIGKKILMYKIKSKQVEIV